MRGRSHVSLINYVKSVWSSCSGNYNSIADWLFRSTQLVLLTVAAFSIFRYGKNSMGIIVAREGATRPWAACNICKKRVIPSVQRIMVDENFENQWWNHLECAMLDLFIPDDNDTYTSPTVATADAQCAWCTQKIVCGRHHWHASWMGWTHAHCHVGNMSDFVDILRMLQKKHPGRAMPEIHMRYILRSQQREMITQPNINRFYHT